MATGVRFSALIRRDRNHERTDCSFKTADFMTACQMYYEETTGTKLKATTLRSFQKEAIRQQSDRVRKFRKPQVGHE